MTTMRRRRRTAAALAWPLLLGGLTACGQDDSTTSTPGSDTMMQRQSQTRSDPGGRRSFEAQNHRHQLDGWCQDLLGDGSWPGMDTRERDGVLRTMHRRMRSLRDDSALPMMSPGQGSGPSMTSLMTRTCRTIR
jgi:hypothetical protein